MAYDPDLKETYEAERDNITRLRNQHPDMPASTLARKIAEGDLAGAQGRTFYSAYSVIRRFDAKRKRAAALATA